MSYVDLETTPGLSLQDTALGLFLFPVFLEEIMEHDWKDMDEKYYA